ncbi:MAG TPA: Abortive infection protein AbiEi [Ignavibacteria bacterium]
MIDFIEIFKQNKGYAQMLELKKKGVHTRTIAKAVQNGFIEKIKPGIYKLVDYPWDEHASFADVCRANRKAVICLLSAASYYELTTFNPPEIYVAVPNNTSKFKLEYPPIKVYYFVKNYYEPGIEKLYTKSGNVSIYNKEKTICDLFRYINKIGEDVTLESLKTYMHNKKKNIAKLFRYAEICGVKNKVELIVKGVLP